MSEPTITKDLKNKRLTIEHSLRAPLARVWQAWTTEERLVRWWGPQDWPAETTSFAFAEGGHWHFRMTGPQGDQVWIMLRFSRVRPQKTLVMEDYLSDPQGNLVDATPNASWTVSFKKTGPQATSVVVKLSFATEAALNRTLERGFEAGFTSALDNLSTLVTGRSRPQTVQSRDGTTIVYEKVGRGPALILVSGAMVTRDFSGTTALAGLLASHFTVYNYDRRGRGESADTPPYSIDREIEDLAAVMALSGEEAFVYGMSSGAILALYAAAAGLKMKGLILYEAPFVVEPTDRHPPADSLERVTQLIAQGRRAAAVTFFMTQVFGMPPFLPLILRLTPYWRPSLEVAHTIPYDLSLTGDFSIPARFTSITLPSLVLYGEKTQALLVHSAQALAKALPQARLKALGGQSHDVDAAVLAPAIEAFCEEIVRIVAKNSSN